MTMSDTTQNTSESNLTPSEKQNHDNRGKFVKGNTAALGREQNEVKKACREELYKCALTLRKTIHSAADELKDPNYKMSRLEYLTTKAVTGGKHQFIIWILEMVMGKPKESFVSEGDDGLKITLNYHPVTSREEVDFQ